MFCRRHAKFLVPLVPRRVQLVPRRAHQLPNYRTCTCHGKENLRRSRRTDAGDGREGPKASGRPFWKAFGRGDAQAKARQGRTDDQSGRPSAREHKNTSAWDRRNTEGARAKGSLEERPEQRGSEQNARRERRAARGARQKDRHACLGRTLGRKAFPESLARELGRSWVQFKRLPRRSSTCQSAAKCNLAKITRL